MSNLLKSKFLMGVMVVAVMVVGFAAVSVDSASADCSITMTLKVGSTGSEVSCLQAKVGATADGKFGPMTKVSVMAWQSGHGLSADGVVGALTRAALNGSMMSGSYPAGCTSASGYSMTTGMSCSSSMSYPAGCSSTSGYSPTTGAKCDSSSTSTSTGPLAGTDGAISAVNELSSYNNEEVGDGENDVKVAGFEVEASTDGDISLRSAKVSVTITNASGSNNLDDYVDSVTVWQGSTKVGSADAADFDEGATGVWSKTITLSNSVVRADETEKFYVSFDAMSNLDSGDIDSEVMTVDVENLRFEDGSGVVTTETGYDLDGMDVPVSFVSFSVAADTELKLATNNTPTSTIVDVDTSTNTDDVALLKGKFTVEGDSDIWLDEIPVTLTSTNVSGGGIASVTSSVTLEIDGQTFNETVSSAASSAVITFNDLDLNLDAGQSYNFTVSADINDIDAGTFDEGNDLTASIVTANRTAIVAENEQGDSLADATEKTGTAIGNTMTFRSFGVNVVVGSGVKVTPTKLATGSNDVTSVEYEIPMTVTAFGNTLYMGQTAQLAGSVTASNAFGVVLELSSAPESENTSATATLTLDSSAEVESGSFRLNDGESETFTLKVNLTAATDNSSFRARVDQFKFFTDAVLSAAATATSGNLLPKTSYRTGYQLINN